MDINQVRKDIESWIVNFVEVPHPALGGWPPCPYARQARLNNEYEVRIGTNPLLDLAHLAQTGLGDKKVIVIVYDPVQWSYQQFHKDLEYANTELLLPLDIIVLEDHPAAIEDVNGVIMNQGKYALALVQSLSDLDSKAKLMANKSFYDSWPEEYLQELFQHRQDPRK
jgi:hypothetical protein